MNEIEYLKCVREYEKVAQVKHDLGMLDQRELAIVQRNKIQEMENLLGRHQFQLWRRKSTMERDGVA